MKQLPRTTEPDTGEVHFQPAPGTDQVTLCGKTSWLFDKEPGTHTRKKVTCWACKQIAMYIQLHTLEGTL